MMNSSIESLSSSEPASESLFEGDTGAIPLETRRVLVKLLLGPALDAHRQAKLWPILLRDEGVIRARLHELFLELVVDHEQQVAFTRQIEAEDLDFPVLLRRSPLTFLQSALVLFLRQQLIAADARGERAVVSRDELVEHLSLYERPGQRDEVRFARQAEGAVESAKRNNLLRKLRGGEERYEVSPTLKLLFSAEQIQALMRAYEEVGDASELGQGENEAGFEEESGV